jgi:hypothetical protein
MKTRFQNIIFTSMISVICASCGGGGGGSDGTPNNGPGTGPGPGGEETGLISVDTSNLTATFNREDNTNTTEEIGITLPSSVTEYELNIVNVAGLASPNIELNRNQSETDEAKKITVSFSVDQPVCGTYSGILNVSATEGDSIETKDIPVEITVTGATSADEIINLTVEPGNPTTFDVTGCGFNNLDKTTVSFRAGDETVLLDESQISVLSDSQLQLKDVVLSEGGLLYWNLFFGEADTESIVDTFFSIEPAEQSFFSRLQSNVQVYLNDLNAVPQITDLVIDERARMLHVIMNGRLFSIQYDAIEEGWDLKPMLTSEHEGASILSITPWSQGADSRVYARNRLLAKTQLGFYKVDPSFSIIGTAFEAIVFDDVFAWDEQDFDQAQYINTGEILFIKPEMEKVIVYHPAAKTIKTIDLGRQCNGGQLLSAKRGHIAVLVCDDSIFRLDTFAGQVVASRDHDLVYQAEFSALSDNGELLVLRSDATNADSSALSLFDTDLTVLDTYNTKPVDKSDIVFSPDASALFMAIPDTNATNVTRLKITDNLFAESRSLPFASVSGVVAGEDIRVAINEAGTRLFVIGNESLLTVDITRIDG